MDHFVGGVWDDLHLTDEETAAIAGAAACTPSWSKARSRALERLGEAGRLGHLQVTADFLGFRHYTVERFARTMRHVDIGFVGWPGDEDDPTVRGHPRRRARRGGRLVVVTLGSRGVLVFDGRDRRATRRDPGRRRCAVVGTTVGCGDAFIAAFLAASGARRDVAAAVEAGKAARGRGDGLAAAAPRRGVRRPGDGRVDALRPSG